MYPDPDVFNPDRWLVNGGPDSPVRADNFAFGFGRRRVCYSSYAELNLTDRCSVCPGRDFAENSVRLVN